jgi:large subunit ribosomal protein L4
MAAKKESNIALIKQALLAYQANKRQSNASVKTRGETSGGGRKPWRQKGTGRARAGSTRSPIWVGGGRAFGPRPEQNYKLRLPKKMQRAALAQVLQLNKDKIKTVTAFDIKEPKTKLALAWLKERGFEGGLVLVAKNVEPELILATNNLKEVSVVLSSQLSVMHFASDATVVMEKEVYETFFPETKTAKEKPVKAKKPAAKVAKKAAA